MLGQSRILNNVLTFIDNFGYTEEDTVLSALPLFHVMGCLFTAMLIFMVGGQLVLTGLQDSIKEVFDMTGFSSIFTIQD